MAAGSPTANLQTGSIGRSSAPESALVLPLRRPAAAPRNLAVRGAGMARHCSRAVYREGPV